MADYWKSQPRKFCQYCKCWIADNKPSIDFHERGKNHKENVAAKISEIKKKSIDKAKQEERMSKEFAAMEEAALKAYEEDLKRMEREASGASSPVQSTTRPQPQVRPDIRPQPQPQPQHQQAKHRGKKQHKGKFKGSVKPRTETQKQVWVEGRTDDGNTYYYNTVSGESQWEKPNGFQGGSSDAAQPAQPQSWSCPWMEAVSPEGFTYYYNSQTGESSWEKPADFPSAQMSAFAEGAESQEAAPTGGEEEEEEEEEESEGGAEAPEETPAAEDAEPPSRVPKINFRKRKAEVELSEKDGEDKVGSGEAVQSTTAADPEEEEKKKKKEEEEEEKKKKEEEEEKKRKEEEEATLKATLAKRRKTANPYGAWEQIKEEEDPYAKVDLQLPQVEASSACASSELPPEPKPKFKERVITSLGDDGGCGRPASFRKSKTQNGKNRSIRQRDDDD